MAESRTSPSMIRWRPSERAMVDAAAGLAGKHVSEYVRDSALTAATADLARAKRAARLESEAV